jgi:tetratricopeptide (TPR) repeat protein
MRRSKYRLILAAMAATLTVAALQGEARAEDLPTALSLEAAGRLGDALDAFGQALERPGNSAEDLEAIYLHLSMLRFGVGDRTGALQALTRLLALDRDATLPPSAPPELGDLMEQARGLWGERAFRATVEAPGSSAAGEPATVTISVVDDVAGIVGGAALLAGSDAVAEQRGRGPVFELSVPPDALAGGLPLVPTLLDEHGGTLWQGDPVRIEAGASDAGDAGEAVSGDAPHAARARGDRRALRIAGWTLLGASLLAGGGGGAMLGIDGTVIESREVDGRTQERRYTTATVGWVLVGVAGAGLVTAVVLVALGYRRGQEAELALRMARGEVARW